MSTQMESEARRGSIKRFLLRAIKFHPRSDFWGQCQTRQKYLQAGAARAGAGWSQPSLLALDLASPPQLLQFGKCNSPHLISGASLLLAALHLYLITHPDFKAQNVLCKIGNFYLKVKYIVWNCSGAFKIKGVEWSGVSSTPGVGLTWLEHTASWMIRIDSRCWAWLSPDLLTKAFSTHDFKTHFLL